MRPTLLRVLTDLYVQKLQHTPEEEDRYTELALRLLDSVDIDTRIAVARLLARHLAPPPRVIERLAADIAQVVTTARASAGTGAAPGIGNNASDVAGAQSVPAASFATASASVTTPIAVDTELAGELDDTFFAASPDERRLILINLDVIGAPGPGGSAMLADTSVMDRLETAALARQREEFNRLLAWALEIAGEQAERIGDDPSGEPVVVAAKALGMAREVLYRILLFINPTVGHSVERVNALVNLYDEMSVAAAQHLVAVWQALNRKSERVSAAKYRPVTSDDTRSVRPADRALQRPPWRGRNQNRRAS